MSMLSLSPMVFLNPALKCYICIIVRQGFAHLVSIETPRGLPPHDQRGRWSMSAHLPIEPGILFYECVEACWTKMNLCRMD